MKLVSDSLTFVIVGDWNQFYLDTSKIVSNVFQKDKVTLEMGWSSDGSASLLLKDEYCTLQPSSEKFILTASSLEKATVERFDALRVSLIKYAVSPMVKAYGFNIRLAGGDPLALASAVDNFQDSSKLTETGAIVEFSQFNQKVLYEGMSFNITYSFGQKDSLAIAVNQHTEHNGSSDAIELSNIAGREFLDRVIKLFTSIGYSFEG